MDERNDSDNIHSLNIRNSFELEFLSSSYQKRVHRK